MTATRRFNTPTTFSQANFADGRCLTPRPKQLALFLLDIITS